MSSGERHMAIASRLVWLSVHVAVCTTGASAGQWTILHNVDFPHRLVGSPGVAPGTAYLKAPNASVCALHCLAMKDCAAIAWNAGSDHDCNFKCDDIPYPGPHTGQQAIVVRKGGRFCPAKPPPLPPPCPAGQTCWHRWSAAHPPKDAAPSPFKPSTALSHIEYSDTVAIPAGVGGDTWYVSQINATHLFASWTDGGLTSQGGHDKGVYYRAAGFPTPSEAQAERGGNSSSQKWCTDEPSHSGNTPAAANCKQMPWRGYSTGFGVVQFSSNSPKNGGLDPTIVLGNLGTVQADAVPYEGRYPAGVLSYKGTLFYGTYALAVPANPGDNKMDGCGNWCVQGPWFGMRTSTDGGISFNEPRTTPKSLSDNIFGEALQFTGATPYPFDNGTYGWVGKIKFGAPQVVDMGIDLEHSPDGKFYLLGHGAEHSDEPQAWMQGSSVYMARCNPTVADVNDKSKWEFYSGTSGHEGEASWSRGDVGAATPLFVWPNRTGVATMS